MTTIVWDGKTLAVDSQTSHGDRLSHKNRQKLFLNVGDYAAVAVAGNTCDWPPIINWIQGHCSPTDWQSSWDAVAWCVREDGTCERFVSGYPETIDGPDSDGTGAEFALGAMEMGATAEQALRIAMKWCLYTGGDVQAYTVN